MPPPVVRGKDRSAPAEAVPHVHRIELEAVRLQVVARTERVVDEIVVIFQAEALRFELARRRPPSRRSCQTPQRGQSAGRHRRRCPA